MEVVMPRSYADDLRERVLLACEQREGSRADIARRFRVGESTVDKWLQVARSEGRRQAKPHAGGPPPKLDAAGLQPWQDIVLETKDGTRAESGERRAARTGCRLGAASLCRALQKRTLTRKKTLHASQLERADIAQEHEEYKTTRKDKEATRLVFLDETGINTQMTRTHARAKGGKPACGSMPCGQWRRVTILGALSLEGIIAAMTIEAATSATVFLAYVQEVLIPTLFRVKPNAMIVMDNLSAHKNRKLIQALVDAKFELCFLPRYSPDLSPIEPCWSKVKAYFRERGARSVERLTEEAGPALDRITPDDARGCFLHCGYAL